MGHYKENLKIKVSENFFLHEFLHPALLNEKEPLRFLNQNLVNFAEFLRSYYGSPVLLNNYGFFTPEYYSALNNFLLKNRGVRHFKYNPGRGAAFSDHLYCNALDFNVKKLKDLQVYNEIKSGGKLFTELNTRFGFNTLEDIKHTDGWIHMARRPNLVLGEFNYLQPLPTIIIP